MVIIKKQYQGIVLLVIIILLMLILKVRYGFRDEKSNNDQITNKELTPTLSEKDFPLEKYLPYSGKGFTVDKYTAPMTLQMTITTATKQQASKEVTAWINSFKEVTGQHKIIIKN